MTQTTDRPLTGILLMNAGIAIWVVHDAISKWLMDSYPVFELLFMRSLVSVPLLMMALRWERGRLNFHTTRLWPLMFRGLLSVASFGLFLFGLKLMSLANAFAIGMSAPLLVAALAGPMLGEPATRRQWAAVWVGFIAVLFMIRPGGDFSMLGAGVMVLSTVFFALSMIMTRLLGRTESAGVMTFYVAMVFLAAGAVCSPFVWVTPTATDLGLMITAGAFSAVAMYCTTQAFRLAPVSLVVPIEYIGLVWAVLIGYLIWHDVPSPPVLVASAVIVISGLYLVISGAKT